MRAGGMVKKENGLKKPSKGQVGLKKLPKAVRNKMGYMAAGGADKRQEKINGYFIISKL